MIADLKADSARWEADVARRADQGYPRGTYIHDFSVSQAPNRATASYASSVPEPRPQPGPSPPPAYSAPPPQYIEPYPPQPAYPQSQSPSYPATSTYPPTHPPAFGGSNQNPYPAQHIPYTAVSQPPVSADVHSGYTYAPTAYTAYENGRNNAAPRYPGPGYEADPDYSPGSSGIAYPPTSVPDTRIGGYNTTPDYGDRNRPRAAGEPRRR